MKAEICADIFHGKIWNPYIFHGKIWNPYPSAGKQGGKKKSRGFSHPEIARYYPFRGGDMGVGIMRDFGWCDVGRRVLLYALQHHPHAKVALPTAKEIDPPHRPHKVWVAVDGLKILLQRLSDWTVQN